MRDKIAFIKAVIAFLEGINSGYESAAIEDTISILKREIGRLKRAYGGVRHYG